jgi:tetratricopeptide (TPR) repeat protein
LLEIKAHFDAQIQVATITITQPTFIIPSAEFNGKRSAELVKIWERARNKYEYALKINELSSKFGRVQNIVGELRSLYDLLPNSVYVRKHLAYANWLLGDRPEALRLYRETAVIAKEAIDWLNLAAIAIIEKQEKLALYALEQYFTKASPSQTPQAWFLLLRLIIQQSSQFILGNYQPKGLSIEDAQVLFQTTIYLFEISERKNQAIDLLQKFILGVSINQLAIDALRHFSGQPDMAYQEIASAMIERPRTKPISRPDSNKPQGDIFSYKADRNFGFIRGNDGGNYFFHRSAISDDELFEKVRMISIGEKIPVVFEITEGPKGPLAIGITLIRTIDEMYSVATGYANDGEYPKAIAQIKKVLEIDPDYNDAQSLYEKWREYARSTGVPRGSNPYARAKRLQLIEKDLDRAAQLLRVAIIQGDNLDSAVKDLGALLAQQGKIQDAIDVLSKNRSKMLDQRSVDNMLITFYQGAGMYDSAITLLQKKYSEAPTDGKKAQIMWQIANGYFRQENYPEAERSFRSLVKLQPDNNAAQRNLAVCLFKQGRHEDSKKILNKILSTSPDPQVADLLDAIVQAKSGLQPQLDEKIIETTLSSFSSETSGFTQFFLERCDFQGVPPDRVQKQTFSRSDIKNLEGLATKLGTSRPRDRATYYLSAAKIVSLLDDEDPNLFFRYLCRSFASRGDAAIIETRHLDSAREFYCESVNAYDGDRSKGQDEQDAVNAIVRYLFSTLGHSQIPITPKIPSLDETLETVFQHHPDRNKLFDSISYLILRSRFAANRIINRLYNKSSLQAMALDYIKLKCDSSISGVKSLDSFIRLWNDLQRKVFDDNHALSYEIQFIGKTELTTASLEGGIERVKGLINQLFFELDQQRALQLQKILEIALELCKQFTFEEQERLCVQIDSRCQDLLHEIESTPTRLSVEEIYPVIDIIRTKVSSRLQELYESSAPQLTLRLPVESYTPDNNQQIDIQITVNNRIGCSPADALELVVQEYADTYSLAVSEVKSESSLRGGDQRILKIPIRLGKEALESQTFSLPVYVQYRTRSSEIVQTPVNNFSIRLYSEEEFEPIENPYAAYAEGGVVGDPNMFFGRDEMIGNVAKAIQESKSQSKCVVIYGQKRAGKSSILYHLKSKLELDEKLLVLDIGNIGKFLDDNSTSSYQFLYLILWSIIRRLEYAIEDRVEAGKSDIEITFPSNEKDFFEHPSPLTLFADIFENFKRQSKKDSGWQNIRAVLLIDEFQYIYAQILAGRIPESFMRNWKALLQENYFSAVLVGQDVMPKFKQRFPNEFGTTQDERVSYLKRDDAIKLIDEPIRVGGRQGDSRFRERAIERILDLTAGSPFYVQILCNRLVEYMNRKRARLVTEADVEQVKDELVKGANALGLDKFDNLLNSGDTSKDAISDSDALKVLTAITLSSLTGPCNRNNITCETTIPIDDILDDLVKRDVVERERGQYYSIRVGLFKEWLVTHQ